MSLEQFGYREELRRALTTRDLVIHGMIFMLPIAPFLRLWFRVGRCQGHGVMPAVPTWIWIGGFIGFNAAAESNHFFLRQRSGDWVRHLVFPLIGLAIGALYYGVLALRGQRLSGVESGGSA